MTSLVKGNILGRLDPFKGSINSIFITENNALIAPQGEGVYWTDINKFKRIFHSPAEVSASAIVRVHSPTTTRLRTSRGTSTCWTTGPLSK